MLSRSFIGADVLPTVLAFGTALRHTIRRLPQAHHEADIPRHHVRP